MEAALAVAAERGRFAEEDLPALLRYQAGAQPGDEHHASEQHSLQGGTSAWAGFGR